MELVNMNFIAAENVFQLESFALLFRDPGFCRYEVQFF